MIARGVLGATGLLGGVYGAVLLLRTGLDNVVGAALWLGGGVLVHDALLAPLTLALAVLVLRVVPGAARAWVAVAAVVVATTTVVAIPVLGRFGAEADNPTLLPRDYVGGWLLLVGVVVLATALVGVLTTRVRRRSHRVESARP